MRPFPLPLLLVVFAGLALRAFGADGIEDPVPTESWILQVLNFLTTVKGLAPIAIAAGVVQLLMVAFKTPLAAFTGRFRFLLVSTLSVAGVVLAGMASGLSFVEAVGSGAGLAAVQVWVNQLWKQVFTPKGDQVGGQLPLPGGR